MARLSNEQYQRWHKAGVAGNLYLQKEIESEGYNGISKCVIDAEIIEKEEEIVYLPTYDDIQAGMDEGKTKKQIGQDFGISAQKVSAIYKKGE